MLQTRVPGALAAVQAKPGSHTHVKPLSAPQNLHPRAPRGQKERGPEGQGHGATWTGRTPTPVPLHPHRPLLRALGSERENAQDRLLRCAMETALPAKDVRRVSGHLLTQNHVNVYPNDLGNAFITCSKLGQMKFEYFLVLDYKYKILTHFD